MAIRMTEPQIEFIEFERIPSGTQLAEDEPLPARDLELELGVLLRELPDLPADLNALRALPKTVAPDPLIGRYVLVDKKNDDRVVATFSLRKKLNPYCRGHMVLTNLNLDAKKLDVYGLSAALLFLKDRGEGTYGFFTSLAPGHRSSDFESVREPLPIWNYVAQDGWIPLRNGRVQMGGLRGWFFPAQCFSSAEPKPLATLLWKFLEQGRLDQHDLLLAYDHSWFQCIPVERRAAKPMSFSVSDPEEYRDFGGTELCGLVTAVRTKAMIEKLASEPSEARRLRLTATYSEICRYTISTTPYLSTTKA